MEFTLNVLPDHVNAILAGLNELKHGASRATFDHILQQVQAQEAAAKASEADQPAGLSD